MAALGPAHDADAAAVRLGELARDREPEPRALDAPARLGAAAEERIEDGLALFGRHARAGVDDLDDPRAAVGVREDRDVAAHDADAAAVRLGELARDREPEPRALDAPARLGAAEG